jgi:hypothetical protein
MVKPAACLSASGMNTTQRCMIFRRKKKSTALGSGFISV